MENTNIAIVQSDMSKKLEVMFNMHFVHTSNRDKELCKDMLETQDKLSLAIKFSKDVRLVAEVASISDAFNTAYSIWDTEVKELAKAETSETKAKYEERADKVARACIAIAKSTC